MWELKNNYKITPNLKWSIVKEIKSHNNATRSCRFCLYEKFAIPNYPSQDHPLNKTSELVSKCRHQNKFLLANYQSKD